MTKLRLLINTIRIIILPLDLIAYGVSRLVKPRYVDQIPGDDQKRLWGSVRGFKIYIANYAPDKKTVLEHERHHIRQGMRAPFSFLFAIGKIYSSTIHAHSEAAAFARSHYTGNRSMESCVRAMMTGYSETRDSKPFELTGEEAERLIRAYKPLWK